MLYLMRIPPQWVHADPSTMQLSALTVEGSVLSAAFFQDQLSLWPSKASMSYRILTKSDEFLSNVWQYLPNVWRPYCEIYSAF